MYSAQAIEQNFYLLLSRLSCQDPRAEQLKYELEKKDQEIDKLKKTISQWEVSSHKQLVINNNHFGYSASL